MRRAAGEDPKQAKPKKPQSPVSPHKPGAKRGRKKAAKSPSPKSSSDSSSSSDSDSEEPTEWNFSESATGRRLRTPSAHAVATHMQQRGAQLTLAFNRLHDALMPNATSQATVPHGPSCDT